MRFKRNTDVEKAFRKGGHKDMLVYEAHAGPHVFAVVYDPKVNGWSTCHKPRNTKQQPVFFGDTVHPTQTLAERSCRGMWRTLRGNNIEGTTS